MPTYTFISQPMRWQTREETAEKREQLCEKVIKKFWGKIINEKLQNISSYFDSLDFDVTSVIMLWESIKMLAGADRAYFAKWWEEARWCRIEHEVAKSYGIEIVYEE